MTLEEQVAVNQFGQGVLSVESLLLHFSQMSEARKRHYLTYLSDLIWQSKPVEADIEQAIIDSLLKSTYTPCVVLRTHRLKIGINQLVTLPVNELEKVYRLMLSLFKEAYQRRFQEEGNSGKWWYWDLSTDDVIERVLSAKRLS
ncbi:DUF5958 family protein [Spirosoma lituiforme]